MSVVLLTAFQECLFLMVPTSMSMKDSKVVEHVRSKGPVLHRKCHLSLILPSSDPGKYRTRGRSRRVEEEISIRKPSYLLKNEIASAEELDQIR